MTTPVGRLLGSRTVGTLVLELVVVVVGILLALEFDRWSQERADRALEADYLERLVDDLSIEKVRMRDGAGFARDRIASAMLLDSVVRGVGPSPSLARMAGAVETVTWRSFPVVDAVVYRELQSTGRLALIRSEPLRRMLAEHYTTIEHDARVGEDLSAQQRFEAAVAGLLHIEEQRQVELGSGADGETHLPDDPERVADIAQELRALPAATRELGNLVQHLTFNLRVIDDAIRRADEIIGYIRMLQTVAAR